MQILDVSTRLFFDRGYAAVSIDEIGALSGVSGPAIYRHFRSKVDILSALFELTIERLVEYVGPVRNSAVEELDALIIGQARLAVRHAELVRVFEDEERALPEARRREIRRQQKAHAKRWTAALATIHPDRSLLELEFLSYAAIGLILSVPRWPKALRTHAELEEKLVAIGRAALEMS